MEKFSQPADKNGHVLLPGLTTTLSDKLHANKSTRLDKILKYVFEYK